MTCGRSLVPRKSVLRKEGLAGGEGLCMRFKTSDRERTCEDGVPSDRIGRQMKREKTGRWLEARRQSIGGARRGLHNRFDKQRSEGKNKTKKPLAMLQC